MSAVMTRLAHSSGAALELEWGAATHRGRIRQHNEDAHLARGAIFMVADGMGGHERGDLASETAVATFEPLTGADWISPQTLYDTVAAAAGHVRAVAAGSGPPPGTTISGVVATLVGDIPHWMIFNIGDSRTYLLRSQRLEQISIDHSQVQERIDLGEILPHSPEATQGRNVITRALGAGMDRDPEADQWLVPIHQLDRLLVCSDGLSNDVSFASIQASLATQQSPKAAADSLVASALAAGGHDNITAVVVDAVSVSVGRSAVQSDVDEDTASSYQAEELRDCFGDTIPGPGRSALMNMEKQ